ncbi:MAG: hypothetical protein J5736_02925 [Bacilli bacterium]|nr:hypothetical protein [Bacilli bacterium]
MAREKLNEEQKAKLVYSGELAFFALVFFVLGILLLTNVLHPSNLVLRQIFVYVSLAGGAWVIADFIWCLLSEKRRKKNSMLDKASLLPVALSIMSIDVITLVQGFEETLELHRIAVGIVFLYIALAYGFQAFYHYKHPHPAILKMLEDAKAEEEKQKELLLDQQVAQTPEETPSEGEKEEKGK